MCYNFNLCNYNSKIKAHVKQHVESQYEGVYFKCDQCDYRAKAKVTVKQHVERYFLEL